jgi:hypothetical protein
MVEVEIDDAAVISTHCAPAAGIVDEHPLDALEASGHGLADAALTAPSWAGATVQRELDHAVTRTPPHLRRTLSLRIGRTPAFLRHGRGASRSGSIFDLFLPTNPGFVQKMNRRLVDHQESAPGRIRTDDLRVKSALL